MVGDLTLGSFDLINPTGSPYKAFVEAEGTSRGGPVPIEVAVKSWLQDGSIVATQGYDNREVKLRVKFVSSNLAGLSQAEAAFFAELGKPNTLTWTPQNGPASVFDVITSSMEFNDNDFVENGASPWRTYNVRLVCAAFVRSVAEVTAAALPATGSTTTNLDTCSATTGWTGFVDGGSVSPATSGGAVTVTGSLSNGVHTMALQKTFAATTTSTKFLVIDWKAPADAFDSVLAAVGDSVSLPLLFEGPSPTSGYVRSMFQVAASSLAVTRLNWSGKFDSVSAPTSAVLSVDNVAVSNVNPIYGTGRQQARSLTVTGSARTQGALAIESATAALGDTMVYVYPSDASTNGYSPPLRQFRTSGNTVTGDATMVSGSREALTGAGATFTIPIGLFPAGSYLLMIRAANATPKTGAFGVSAKTLIGSNNVGDFTFTSAPCDLTSTYQNFPLTRLMLPTVALPPNSTASMVMVLTETSATYDEVWLFNITIGSLIRVDCGTGAGTAGGSARRLFIEPPTVTTPRPTVRIGHSADRSDSFHPVGSALSSWQFPQFEPEQVNAFVVTPNATDASVALRHYPRWHTHAAS